MQSDSELQNNTPVIIAINFIVSHDCLTCAPLLYYHINGVVQYRLLHLDFELRLIAEDFLRKDKYQIMV